ncbi:MAG: N-acetylmannosamine-6-phosphate 2-epimerase [Trueperaceae bacterium]
MLTRGLIVSCQARPDNPLHGPEIMAAMARAAEQGGAAGIRANEPDDIASIRQSTALPIIGIYKREIAGFATCITPDLASARAVAEAGADIVAVDATARPHPEGSASDLIRAVKRELRVPVFADVSKFDEGIEAARAGADYVATTLAGYTADSAQGDGPDLELLAALARAIDVPVVAEGRFWTPLEVEQAFEFGAFAVVVGTAITNPREITRRFAAAVPEEDS